MKIINRILIIIVLLITSMVWGAEKRKPLWFVCTDPAEGIDYQLIKIPVWVVERAEKLDFDKNMIFRSI